VSFSAGLAKISLNELIVPSSAVTSSRSLETEASLPDGSGSRHRAEIVIVSENK
jgi:hypothetical protein